MSKRNCSRCRFWEATKEDLHRGDGGTMDTIRPHGWCEKDKTAKYARQLCDSYEPQLQYQKQ
jgi:hypothetical protein